MEVKQVNKKDVIAFFDKNLLREPLSDNSRYIVHLAENDPEQQGVILPNGTINWGCPCLGTASIGPCSYVFREAFKCFHYSQAEIKGSDCLVEFDKLQNCMKKFPKLYK